MKHFTYFAAVLFCAAYLTTPSLAEERYIGVFGGFQFGNKATDIKGVADSGYGTTTSNLSNITASDVDLENSLTGGVKGGYIWDNGFGIEAQLQYSRPDLGEKNVNINSSTADFYAPGVSSITSKQYKADFSLWSASAHVLYKGNYGRFKPYIGAGPAIYRLTMTGEGKGGNVVAPASVATNGYSNGENLNTTSNGIGFKAKLGNSMDITENISFDMEYQYSWGKFDIQNFREYSEFDTTLKSHDILLGLRMKF